MDAHLIVDAVIIAIIIAAFISGWRLGAFTALLSTVGVVAGLVVGLAAAPLLVNLVESHVVRIVVLIAVVVFFVGMGNLVGVIIGSQLRDRARFRGTQRLDSIVGSLFQAVAVTVVVWFISLPLAASTPGKVGDGIRDSAVLSAIDGAAPAWVEALPTRLAALLDESGLPPLVSPFASPSHQQVDAPNPTAIDAETVERLRPGVVHVMGDAQTCSRRLRGSGFVAADDYVLTNAHVVAGTETVSLDTVLGVKEAQVVYYNPDVDIALLHSEDLGLNPLPRATHPLTTGDDAMVMGFPASGPFKASPARIRDRISIAGPDIYATGRVERDAYTLRGSVRQGNSGGPLINPQGEVVGMIFGASVDSSETGYALTLDQVLGEVGTPEDYTVPASTQSCVVG